ncbi:MAG: multiprotein bridging factor aMBF1 [Methanomicrobiaceae archaeon]|nr:multiprotein bridging factor aMBF1 [Methanomicrobiaceae archaeon]
MQCELCGAKIRGPPKIVHIEGAELRVCAQCVRYGTEVNRPRAGTVPGAPSRRGPAPPPSAPRRRTRDVFDLMEGEIADDYYIRIRKARMEKGLGQKELAHEIKEREVLIKKIEKGDLIPEDEVRKKLEEALDISLLERSSGDVESKGAGRITTTLGDVMKIKKGGK